MALSRIVRQRCLAMGVVLVVIPIGLFARSQRSGADPSSLTGFLACYTGDTLWAVLFYFLGRCTFPSAARGTLVAATILLTLTIEFSQRWQTPTLDWLRAQRITGFLLGNAFLWSDVACLLVGTGIAVLLDRLLFPTSRSEPA